MSLTAIPQPEGSRCFDKLIIGSTPRTVIRSDQTAAGQTERTHPYPATQIEFRYGKCLGGKSGKFDNFPSEFSAEGISARRCLGSSSTYRSVIVLLWMCEHVPGQWRRWFVIYVLCVVADMKYERIPL